MNKDIIYLNPHDYFNAHDSDPMYFVDLANEKHDAMVKRRADAVREKALIRRAMLIGCLRTLACVAFVAAVALLGGV